MIENNQRITKPDFEMTVRKAKAIRQRKSTIIITKRRKSQLSD